MVHSVSLGLYLATCLVGIWLLRERLSQRWQVLALAAVPLLMAGLFLTKTRSVWLGAATGIVVVLALTLKGRLRWGVLGSIVAAGVLLVMLNFDGILGIKREGTVQDTHRSNSMRGSFAYVSWLMFQDKPINGFGFGQFAREKLPYLSDRTTELHLESIRDWEHHNTFLSVLTETGLVGFLLLMMVLFGWANAGWQLHRDQSAPPWVQRHGKLLLAMLGISFWQMLGHEITFTSLDMALIFCLAGIAVGLKSLLAIEKTAASLITQKTTEFPKFEQWRAAN
jgi:O-antigen ligase